jgi:AcrR family transcriptional regulator
MSKKSKSQKAIIEVARKLFWQYGIRKTTVEEICKKAGVSKMTFYRAFPNKVELAKEILREIMEESVRKYKDIAAKEIPYTEKVKEMILMKRNASNEISKEFIEEAYFNQELGIASIMDTYRQKTIQLVMDDFKEAQEAGHIRKDIDLRFLMYMLNVMASEAIINDHLLNMYSSSHEAIMEVTNFFFYGIMNPTES